MTIESYLAPKLKWTECRTKLESLPNWTWRGGESFYVGSHLKGTHTSGITCELVDATGEPPEYELAVTYQADQAVLAKQLFSTLTETLNPVL